MVARPHERHPAPGFRFASGIRQPADGRPGLWELVHLRSDGRTGSEVCSDVKSDSRPAELPRLEQLGAQRNELKRGRMNIVALGISTEGDKLALGLWDGSAENATVAAALLRTSWTAGGACGHRR